MNTFSIAKQFSKMPGARLKVHGPYSGEELRDTYLDPLITSRTKTLIDLDGAYGYAASFLDEVFGGLSKKYGSQKVLETFSFICEDEPYLVADIISYIHQASHNQQHQPTIGVEI